MGTGFIGKGLVKSLQDKEDLYVARVLTRRELQTVDGIAQQVLTNSIDDLLENSDLIVECSGDVIYGTDVIDKAMECSLPVVTMNSELQITTGSYFARKGFITEAEGDQPGSLAALRENMIEMGFKPLVYGNIKGFLNENPTPEDMSYWSNKSGISLEMVTSFTDGTKVNIEQVLVANGLGGTLGENGIRGPVVDTVVSGGEELAREAKELGLPISDYIVCPAAPPGVFITAEHNENQREALQYLKVGNGPFYTLLQNHHLCHLEIIKTIRRVFKSKEILINNTHNPTYSVSAIAKKSLTPGEEIAKGIGSFDVRGKAVKISEHPDHIPIGLLSQAIIIKPIEKGEALTFDKVHIPDSLASRVWAQTLDWNRSSVLG